MLLRRTLKNFILFHVTITPFKETQDGSKANPIWNKIDKVEKSQGIRRQSYKMQNQLIVVLLIG